jgi:hypothetical protein
LTPEEARNRLFYECVPNWKRGFVRFHRVLRPKLYQLDWRLVDEAGKSTSYQEVLDAIDRWNHRSPAVQSLARDRWQWRVSGRRLLTLALALFKDSADPVETMTTRPAVRPLAAEPPPKLPAPAPAAAKLAGKDVTDMVRAHG